jgi:hypothetical protein
MLGLATGGRPVAFCYILPAGGRPIAFLFPIFDLSKYAGPVGAKGHTRARTPLEKCVSSGADPRFTPNGDPRPPERIVNQALQTVHGGCSTSVRRSWPRSFST